MPGIKHLIECHCVLKIYEKNTKIINHKFPVYSKLNKHNLIIPKLAKCNNCEALHYIYDICKSELRPGGDQTIVTLDIDDITIALPDKLVTLLKKYQCDMATWEHVLDIIENNLKNQHIVLKRDIIDEKQQLKILFIINENKFRVETKTLEDTFLIKD